MSFLGKFGFGGKQEEKTTTTAEGIRQLRETEDMLIKRQEYLEKKIEEEINIARTNGTKNKRAAIQALKRKNRYSKQLQQIDGQLATIELQREALEGANINTAVFQTMKNAAGAMKNAHQNMNADQVHDMMDDIAEQQEVAKEISEAISNPVAFGQDVDDSELEEELEKLEQEALDQELLKAGPSGVDIPTSLNEISGVKEKLPMKEKVSRRREEEEKEMKDLQMWAS